MKKSIFITLAIFISVTCFGQNKKAEILLKNLIKETTSYKAVETEISIKMENSEAGINETKSGKIFFSGNKYRIELPGQYIISDGKTVWTYIEDDEEVMINNVEKEENSFSITNILTSYNDNYNIKYGGQETIKNEKYEIIDLAPKTDNNLKLIQLYVSSSPLRVKEVKSHDKNGSIYIYQIKKFIPLSSFKDSLFTFSEKEFPNVEVNDMR
ncbi:MAG: outer membrane lipoprotein carrier protein LolA [Bacteroidales bacterium]